MGLATSFQFHSGSIKTRPDAWKVVNYRKFQFHSGSIKTQKRVSSPGLASLVSIPLWFD